MVFKFFLIEWIQERTKVTNQGETKECLLCERLVEPEPAPMSGFQALSLVLFAIPTLGLSLLGFVFRPERCPACHAMQFRKPTRGAAPKAPGAKQASDEAMVRRRTLVVVGAVALLLLIGVAIGVGTKNRGLPQHPPAEEKQQQTQQPARQHAVMISVREVNLRSGPGTVYSVIGRGKRNDSFVVRGRKEKWYKIDYQGRDAWVHESAVIEKSDDPLNIFVERGKAIFAAIVKNYPKVEAEVWGLSTPTPVVALVIPEQEWNNLAKADQVSLTFYVESLLPAVRAEPDRYIDVFRDTPQYALFRAKVARLCDDCWVVGIGRLTFDKKAASPDKIVVQGNSVWEKDERKRGVKAAEFRRGGLLVRPTSPPNEF